MPLRLDPERMRATLSKILSTSFGLSLVVGLPFVQPIRTRAAQLEAQIEALLPGRFRWYEPDHSHATVTAPLRGRYRDRPPLQRYELPADLAGFAEALNHCFDALQPFSLDLDRLYLAADGRMLALGADPGQVRMIVAGCLSLFPGLDQPKDLHGWHVTLGYLQTPTPFATEAEQDRFQVRWAKLQVRSLGTMEVDRVWLVHYADRTMRRIVGKVPLLLGGPNELTAYSLPDGLGIGGG
jgi:hypothetical protein